MRQIAPRWLFRKSLQNGRRRLTRSTERENHQAVVQAANVYQAQHPGMNRSEAIRAAEASVAREQRNAWGYA